MSRQLVAFDLAALLLAGSPVGPALAEGTPEVVASVGSVGSNAVLKVGDPAPKIDAVDRQGRMASLSAFAGQAVLLDFGSVYCMDCRNAIVYLEGVRRRYGPQGLAVVMIVVDSVRAAEAVDRYWAEVGAGFPALFDVAWRTGRSYGVEMIPSQFLIDRSGIIRGMHVGYDEAMLPESLMKRVLR